MRTVGDVSTDDLVNSLLNSATTATPSATSDSSSTPSTTSSTDSSPSSESTDSSSSSPPSSASASSSPSSSSATVAPAPTSSPATTSPTASTSGSSETATRGADSDSGSDEISGGGGGGGAALSIGIAIGVLALVVAALLFLRSRRKRLQKNREPAWSPPTGATCLTVPTDRGFKPERDLGLPEMSIELAPGQLKGLDMSYASSSARSSAASNNYSNSVASSTDSSVFNTQGGVSPTFSNRNMTSYSYQYRGSNDESGLATSSVSSNDSTTFHLTGMIGNGNTASNRGGNADTRGRKLSAPDEYAELVTATNAHGHMDMNSTKNQQQELHADFTNSGRSLGPADNQSFLAPLPTRAVQKPVRPSVVRASEESMGPDSPVSGREKWTGSVYDTIPKLSGEKMTASFVRSSEEDPHAMSTASFLSKSSISSTSTRDSVATSTRGSAYVTSMPLLQQLSSADDSDYGEDLSSERGSTDSTDSGNTRAGSIISMNLEAKDGCSEIAI